MSHFTTSAPGRKTSAKLHKSSNIAVPTVGGLYICRYYISLAQRSLSNIILPRYCRSHNRGFSRGTQLTSQERAVCHCSLIRNTSVTFPHQDSRVVTGRPACTSLHPGQAVSAQSSLKTSRNDLQGSFPPLMVPTSTLCGVLTNL